MYLSKDKTCDRLRLDKKISLRMGLSFLSIPNGLGWKLKGKNEHKLMGKMGSQE